MHSTRQDSPGPIAKTAWDIAAMLEIMSIIPQSYTQYAEKPYNDIARYSLAVVSGCLPIDLENPNSTHSKDALKVWNEMLKVCKPALKVGHEVTIPGDAPGWMEKVGQSDKLDMMLLLETEVYGKVNDYLGNLENCKVGSLEELVRWNNDHLVRFFVRLSKK